MKAKAKPFLSGMEQGLVLELEHLDQIINLWEQHPDRFRDMGEALESLKDPSYPVNCLENERTLSPAEMFVLSRACLFIRQLRQIQERVGFSHWPGKTIPPLLDHMEILLAPGSRGQPSFCVSDDYSPTLKETRMLRRQKQKEGRREMGRLALKVDQVLGRKPGVGEEIAFRKADLSTIKKALSMSELCLTRETVSHVYFRLKMTAKALSVEKEISRLRAGEREEETRVLQDLSSRLRRHLHDFKRAVQAVGELDFLMAKAQLSRSMDAVRPEIIVPWDKVEPEPLCKPGRLDLELLGARHPLIQDEVRQDGNKYQPISIRVDSPVSVITGPNMGGKTVTLATVGLCVAMAQWGLRVPCGRLKLRLYDFVHFRAGQEGAPGLSSFATQVMELKRLLSRGEQRGLLLLDEIGRGTNPSQGLALYAAFLHSYLKKPKSGSTAIATTHYQGLAEMLDVPHWQVKGLSPKFFGQRGFEVLKSTHACLKEGGGLDYLKRHMDYSLQKVGAGTPVPQDAILVAEMLGLNENVIKKAKEFHATALRAEAGEVKSKLDVETKHRRKKGRQMS